jgi:radical SAM superfamily enzyme YgiQ (UPF0313 family)
MKILLIEPNINSYALMPTISLSVINGYINTKTKHKAEIIDLVFHKKDWKKYITKVISIEKPVMIGFSVLSFNYQDALKIARFIKQKFNITIIFGGVHVILSPQSVIENNEVDIICTGEGEIVLKEILDKNFNYKKIKGIWYKKNNKIYKNEKRELVQDLDNLAFPDFKDFDIDKYFLINNNHLSIMASRGCPYSCFYCSNHALRRELYGKYVRFRSVDDVINEIGLRIKQYGEKGLKYLYFFDDTFILNKKFVNEFCKKFKQKGFHKKIKWNVNVRADLISDEIIQTMKDAGCYQVRMGIEAGNDYIRNEIYNKNISKEQIINAFKIIKNNDLQLRLYFIVGAPFETIDMMEESFNLAKLSEADEIFFSRLYPLPGTKIKEICDKEGLIKNKNDQYIKNRVIDYVEETKFTRNKEIQKYLLKIKRWQSYRYFYEGLNLNKIRFLFDIISFLIYYKYKYDFELNQIYRWNVQRYKLKNLN